MNINLCLLLLYLLFNPGCYCFFRKKFNKMKERARDYYKKNFVKDKSWHFLGYDPSEYPGADLKLRQENMKKWDQYYSCLVDQEQSLGGHGTPVPEAVQGFVGGSIKFDCKICLSPEEEENMDSVEWYYGETGKPSLEEVLYNEHILLSPQTKTLNLYNLREEHTGQYVCILGDSVTVPYYLTVISGTNQIKQVNPDKSKDGSYASQPQEVGHHNLILDTEWSEWSPCSRCKKVGRRHRTGYCVVLYEPQINVNRTKHTFHEEFKNALFNESYQPHFKKSKGNNGDDETITKTHVDLLKVFLFGIPCKSHILPLSIKNLQIVKDRKDEVMIGYCKVPCKSEEIFQAKNKNGKVIETANNSAGFYSLLQGLPPVSPPVERTLQYSKLGIKVIIMCPGNLNSESPIQWQIDSKIVVPDIIAQESNERITITVLDRIVIAKSKVSDSKLYSCWQNDELAGTVRLVVEKKVRFTFNHHIMLLGMVAILCTFIYVFMKAFFGRKYVKAAN